MKTKVLALAVIVIIVAFSIVLIAEAGQDSREISASGVLAEEKVAVSVPADLALLGMGGDSKSQSTLPTSPSSSKSKSSSAQSATLGTALTSSNGSAATSSKLKTLKPAGVIDAVNIEPGDTVKQGDVLLSVGQAMAEENVKKAQAQYDLISATIDSLKQKQDDLTSNKSKLNSSEATLKAKRGKAVRDFNAKYAAGQANIENMKKQLALLEASGGSPMAIAQLEAGIAQASTGLAAGKQQFNQGLQKMNQGLVKISSGRKKINNGMSQLSGTIDILNKRIKLAEVALSMAKTTLEATKLKAVSGGVVTGLKVGEGSVVYPGQEVMSIIRQDKLKLDIYVPLEDSGKIKVDDPVKVAVDTAPGRNFNGKVIGVGGRAIFAPSNMTTDKLELVRVVKVTVEVTNEEGILKAGMPADVKIN